MDTSLDRFQHAGEVEFKTAFNRRMFFHKQNKANYLKRSIEAIASKRNEIVDCTKEEFVERAMKIALQGYENDRMNGLENDGISEQPGIIVYLDTTEFDKGLTLPENVMQKFYELNISITRLGATLLKIDLPLGMYIDCEDWSRIQFLGMVPIPDSKDVNLLNPESRHLPFGIHHKDVVRIEGYQGRSLWQNPDHKWESLDKSEFPPKKS